MNKALLSTATGSLLLAASVGTAVAPQVRPFAENVIVLSAPEPLTANRRMAAYNAALMASLPTLAEIDEDELPITAEAADHVRSLIFNEVFASFPASNVDFINQIESDKLEPFLVHLHNVVESWFKFLSGLNAERAGLLSKLPPRKLSDLADVVMFLGNWNRPGKPSTQIIDALMRSGMPRRSAERARSELRDALAGCEK